MKNTLRRSGLLLATTLLLAGPAHAVLRCELDGKPINPNNGNDTAGKSGLMRCRDADGGPVVREQELQQGKSMGVMRYFKDGILEREYKVNERGNRDGLSREWARVDGKSVLVHEETLRNSHAIGASRTWYPSGTLKQVVFYGDDEREQASVSFTARGQLADLRCGSQPVFGRDFDDKVACGHAAPVTTPFYDEAGRTSARVAFDHGARTKSEFLFESGSVREQQEQSPKGGATRTFAADGVKRHEVQWVPGSGPRPGRITTLDQEFHESGKLIHERRWRVAEVDGERRGLLVSESTWYLNGQPKSKSETTLDAGRTLRHETEFADNGKVTADGNWVDDTSRGYHAETPIGVHKRFDADGRLRSERTYEEGGRIKRERELDERGTVTRDDEVFEDGSRKSLAR